MKKYDSIEEVLENLKNIKLGTVRKLHENEHCHKRYVVEITPFQVFHQEREILYICSAIVVNMLKSNSFTDGRTEYLLYDTIDWDFMSIEDKEFIERIEQKIREVEVEVE